MKLNSFLILAILLISSFIAVAHEGGHGTNDHKTWKINNQNIEASFLAFKDGQVLLETKTGEVLFLDLSSFSKENQQLINKKIDQIEKINYQSSSNAIAPIYQQQTGYNILITILLVGLLLGSIFVIIFFKKNKKIASFITTLSLLIIIIVACTTDDAIDAVDDEPIDTSVPANNLTILQEHFGHFVDVTTSSDDTYFYISSTGLPEHSMMVGITNWQQQVPIDQNYTETNSWAFPIQPVLAESPLSSSEHFLRGAIAIAVNGIPIFNPLNNRGEDALVIGELDNWGGHCGRADDYHYHVPPTHLESIIGSDQPLAYALDGFPVYGETTDTLDEYLGKFNDDGSYQYHTTNTFPYFIAGMRGEVMLDPNTTAPEDQIFPQAMTQEVRPALTPLAGAEITEFTSTGVNAYSLQYQIGADIYYTNYSWDESGLYTYEYVDSDGNVTTETYQR
ncbi:YHYH protein [Aquimarina sp. Aq107]|uniref:YHYH protein n=1 Tax=Aquimarina sp. Aq107 TaxID=1191912 RepID=UPI000D54F5D0|nr:YHYH protein [Aquimarina sp. Aq107]